MTVESEKDIERYLVKRTAAIGGLSLKLLSTFINGLPDRICLFPEGKIIFVELKTTHIKPRKLQQFQHNVLRKLGFSVFVCDTKATVDEILKSYDS